MQDIFWVFALAALCAVIAGAPAVPLLRILKFGQSVRTDGPQKHLQKAGTPTMGGLIFLTALTVVVLLYMANLRTVMLLGLTWAFALLGLADDFLKVVLKRPLGLKARHKLAGQFVFSLLFAFGALYILKLPTAILFPFVGMTPALPDWLYISLVVLVLVSTTNTVNLTDGLDGLAAGITVVISLGLVVAGIMVDSPSAPGQEVALFAAALGGGCLGFLVYNRHPAKVFMGDTGSLAIGAALAGLTIILGIQLYVPIIGGIFVAEGLSVIAQVLSFRYRGKRVLLMAPLHHHFELKGWPERIVVRRFWMASVVLVLLGILGLYNVG